jgi:hypothetical protein
VQLWLSEGRLIPAAILLEPWSNGRWRLPEIPVLQPMGHRAATYGVDTQKMCSAPLSGCRAQKWRAQGRADLARPATHRAFVQSRLSKSVHPW